VGQSYFTLFYGIERVPVAGVEADRIIKEFDVQLNLLCDMLSLSRLPVEYFI
jgi:hypothetical protein